MMYGKNAPLSDLYTPFKDPLPMWSKDPLLFFKRNGGVYYYNFNI